MINNDKKSNNTKLPFSPKVILCRSNALNFIEQPPPDLDLAQQLAEVPNALLDVPSQPSISDYFSYQVYESPTPEPGHVAQQPVQLKPTIAPEISWYSLDPTDQIQPHQQQEICCNQQHFQSPFVPPTIVHEPQLTISPHDSFNQINPTVQRDDAKLELLARLERLDRLQNRLSRLRRRSRRLQLDLMWMEKRSRERRLYFFDTLWRMTYRQLSSLQERIDRLDHQALRLRSRLKMAVRRVPPDWQQAKLLRETDSFADRQDSYVRDQHKRLGRVKPILKDFQLQYHLDEEPVVYQQNEINF